jgi:thymidylate synthase
LAFEFTTNYQIPNKPKMKQYLDLVQHVMDNGCQKGDRTGTGKVFSASNAF